jgi:hypothetical protein
LIVYLSGGLGNNVLQILYAKSYESLNGLRFISYFQNRNIITKILSWTLHSDVASEIFDLNYDVRRFDLILRDLLSLFLSRMLNRSIRDCSFISNAASIPSHIIMGYAHPTTEVDFNRLLDASKSILKIDIPLLNHIAVHVRRGDIGNNDSLGLLLPCYFNNAVSSEILRYRRPVIVYTNDKKWCKENLDFEFTFDSPRLHTSDVVSDYLGLCSASCLVASNSTFSYTAALIGRAKTVIVPSPFFKNELIFIPEHWVKFSASYQ